MKTINTLLLALTVLVMASCGNEKRDSGDAAKDRLAAYVEKRDRQCPIDVSDVISLTALEYDDDENLVTVNTGIHGSELLPDRPSGDGDETEDYVRRTILQSMIRSGDANRRLLELASKAKAGITFTCSASSADFDLTFTAREIRRALRDSEQDGEEPPADLDEYPDEQPDSLVDVDDEGGDGTPADDDALSEEQQQEHLNGELTTGTAAYRENLPRRIDADLTLTDVQVSSRELVCEFRSDEQVLTIAAMRAMGSSLKSTCTASFDSGLRQLAQLCVDTHRSMAFKYVGTLTNDILVVTLTSGELANALRR